jgi:hypothetical protein
MRLIARHHSVSDISLFSETAGPLDIIAVHMAAAAVQAVATMQPLRAAQAAVVDRVRIHGKLRKGVALLAAVKVVSVGGAGEEKVCR